MKLAFWKRKRPRRKSPDVPDAGPEPAFDPAGDPDADEAAALLVRVRTRRRLIGACALLLAAIILVPMILDPAPRAVPDSIPIDLPSDKTPFAPHLAPPAAAVAPSAAPAPADAAAVPAAPGSAADAAAEAPAAALAAPASAEPPAHPKKHAAAGRIFVQAGAMARQSTAQDLANRLSKAGLAPFVERSETGEGVRYRVRLGPFATRAEADRARARLRALGVDANIVGA